MSTEETKSKKTSTWEDTFPKSFEEKNDSDIFFLRCIYLVFVYIICKRKLLPSHLFKKKTIEGIIKTYVMNSEDKYGLRIANKFRALGEAIKLRFLDSFMLVVGENEHDIDSAVEVYTWKMCYTDGNTSASFISGGGELVTPVKYKGPEHVKQNTRQLLYLVKELCTKILNPLPENKNAGFRIIYTSDAPPHYQAEGFYSCDKLYNLDPRALSYDLSHIKLTTAHHR